MEYKPELNFLTEFKLSKNGMISEIKTEFDIIRLALSQIDELGKDYINMLDRIIVMPLRKLLCEKNSVLIKVCPNFKLPKIEGFDFDNDERLHVQLAPYKISGFHTWICIDEWVKQKIAYFDKDFNDIPQMIEKQTFENILNKLKKPEKNVFSNFFDNKIICINDEPTNVYVLKDSCDVNDKNCIFKLMDDAGYYSLTVYGFIKHLSDKRGAHIDLEIAPLITMINSGKYVTPIQCIAVQLIYAAKKQIPELEKYWHDMPDFDELIENDRKL